MRSYATSAGACCCRCAVKHCLIKCNTASLRLTTSRACTSDAAALLQVHDEVILEGPKTSADRATELVVDCMAKPFDGVNPLLVELVVDAKHADTWYEAK